MYTTQLSHEISIVISITKLYSVPGGGATSSWNGGGGGASITDGQRVQIQELEQRDADFDRQLDEIGEGIKDLAEIAALQSEEVKYQSVMLDHLE